MSYIRCLSNPEGYYIWSDGRHTHIWKGSKIEEFVDARSFHKLLVACAKNYGVDDTPIRVGNMTLREVFVKTGKRVDWLAEYKSQARRDKSIRRWKRMGVSAPDFLTKKPYKHKPYWHQPGDFKIRLTIKKKNRKVVFDFWRVTWEYIERSVMCNQIAGHRKPSRRF